MATDVIKDTELSGLVIVDKGEGITSQGAVNRIKRLFGVKKAGHTGTLDPLATGVLPVLLGRGVKASEFMLTEDKHYIATLLLGITTDTEDITGEVLSKTDEIPSEEAVRDAVSGFIGEIRQVPPMYSAIKVGGKKLYELAREGKVIEREPRKVRIYSVGVEKINDSEYKLDVKCSKGTYIRTLCADIGNKLGVGGVMKALRRAEVAGFDLSAAYTLSELEEMSEESRLLTVLPVESVFGEMKIVRLPEFFEKLARSGLEIYLKKIGISLDVGERVRLYGKDGFFSVGEVRDFPDGKAIKPIRQF